MADAIATAAEVAKRIMPDLNGLELYIVQPAIGSMVEPSMLGNFTGCTYRGLAIALKPQLQAAGQWRGDGIAVVADAQRIAAERPWVSERAIVGLVLHEVTHALDIEPGITVEPELQYRNFVAASRRTVTAAAEPIPTAYWSHSSTFTRMCCHAWYRASRGTFSLMPQDLIFGNAYPTLEALSAPGDYCADLWSEFDPLRRLPLASLKGIEPTAAFTARWRADEERVYQAARAKGEAA